MIAKIEIISMLSFTAAVLMFGATSHVVASSDSQDEEVRKKLSADLIRYEAAYEKHKAELTDEQKNICQAFLDVTKARADRRDEQEILRLYKHVRKLIIDETERTRKEPVRVWRGNSTLWRVFNNEKPLLWTCFSISILCRDSEKMTVQEKIREIKAQVDISNDDRIGKMVIDLLRENERYEDAMDYCKEQISNIEQGKKRGCVSNYQYELIQTRLYYQRSLYGQAMRRQGVDADDVINIGPHLVKIDLVQRRLAEKEAEEYIKAYPQNTQRCIELFSPHSQFNTFTNLKEAKEFHESLLSKLKESGAEAEVISTAAPPAINDEQDEQVAEKVVEDVSKEPDGGGKYAVIGIIVIVIFGLVFFVRGKIKRSA